MVAVSTPEAYRLLHDGVVALSQVEHNGIRIDVDYLEKTIDDVSTRIRELDDKVRSSEVGRVWRREFGQRTKYSSSVQLAKVLFDVMGYDPPEKTEKGNYKTDIGSIEKIDDPFVKDYIKLEKLKHTRGTFLKGIQREVVNGKVHVNFNLSTAVTYRSSSSVFNFQNLPIRDPVQGEMIRRAFIARKGRRIVEIDYGGIEVCIAACYHHDPTMLTYIKDKTKDMHRDMAAKCFKIKPKQVSKMTRYAGKNMFVFPQFYGDWYLSNAKDMWEWMERNELLIEGSDTDTVKKALARAGITERGACVPGERPIPGTFEKHIQKVEKHFWNERFPVYRDWKKEWYNDYVSKGFITTKTGFRIEGVFSRNDIINYPVQGSAFHCLLWALIRIQKELKKRGMKTLIIGQIHDSIVADVPDNEVEDYLQLAHHVMTVLLPKKWKWIIVPLEVEAEVTPVDGTWHDKKAVEIKV